MQIKETANQESQDQGQENTENMNMNQEIMNQENMDREDIRTRNMNMTHLGPHWQSQSPYQPSWSNLYNSGQRMDETANWYINNSKQQQESWQRPITRRFPTSDTRKLGKKEYNDPCYYCMKLGHPKRECEKY